MLRLIFACLVLLATTAHAQQLDPTLFATTARSAILIEVPTGKVFYEKDADYPAATGEAGNLVLHDYIFSQLKAGTLLADQKFKVNKEIVRLGGVATKQPSMNLKNKTEVPLIELVKANMMNGAVDASLLLAIGLGGSESGMVAKLNEHARSIGLRNTTIANVTGKADIAQRMSVRDLSVVARRILLDHNLYLPFYAERGFVHNKFRMPNRHLMLGELPGTDGFQTGYTREEGFVVVGTMQRDGRRFIAVLSGLPTDEMRRNETRNLLDWGFAQYKSLQVFNAGEKVGQARVWGGTTDFVDLVTRDSFQVTLSETERKTAEVKLTYKGPLIAPVQSGTQVGVVKVLVDGRIITELPVMTAVTVNPVTSMWEKALDSTKIMIFGG